MARPEPNPDGVTAGELARRLGLLGGWGLQQVAVLRMGGRSNEEIARELGVSVATVERRLARIRKIWGEAG